MLFLYSRALRHSAVAEEIKPPFIISPTKQKEQFIKIPCCGLIRFCNKEFQRRISSRMKGGERGFAILLQIMSYKFVPVTLLYLKA